LGQEQYKEALTLYEEVLSETSTTERAAKRALVGIGSIYRQSGDEVALDVLRSYTEEQGPLQAMVLDLLVSGHRAQGRTKAGLSAARMLTSAHGGTRYAARGQMAKFFLHFDRGDTTAAQKALASVEAQQFSNKQMQNWGEQRAGYAHYLLQRYDVENAATRPESERTVATKTANTVPDQFAVASYPNPFQQQATIRYKLPEQRRVRLTVYNALGRQVAVLVDERREAGIHRVRFDDTTDLPAGTYFYRLEVSNYTHTGTMTRVK
jgi:hypothetical protein